MIKGKIKGLSSKEAEKRLQEYGLNKLEESKKISSLHIIFSQFKSPLIYILFFAGLITFFLKEWTDSLVIFLAVVVNTFLGFIQEYKAEKSLLALKKLLVLKALVIRDGKEELIEAEKIVPQDLVILTTGSKVPADGIVLEEKELYLNEAILTGESMPLKKEKISAKELALYKKGFFLPERKKEVFMGTTVVSGRGLILVLKTGKRTKMGHLAGKLKTTTEEETPLKRQISRLSKFLALIFLFICLMIFFEGLLTGRFWWEMFTLSVAIAVAAIPESLAVSLTIILTLGMQRIHKRKSLVRKLLAAEILGSVDIICADKTGTLTEGKMQVVKALALNKKLIRKAAFLCNNKTNPLELAMLNWAKKYFKKNTIKRERLEEIPFSSQRKFISILNQAENKKEAEMYLSGAPEMVLAISSLEKKAKTFWQKKLDEFTAKGYRVVAFSYKKDKKKILLNQFRQLKQNLAKDNNYFYLSNLKLNWLGLLLFEDPVRLDVKKAFKECQKAGIKVKVITGDHKNTALAVLRKLNLINKKNEKKVLEGWQLEKISKEKLKQIADKTILFCRATPEQKIKIVEALQSKRHVVAMMGDGVNDALALKKADIGIVVAEASEVAKETADMVLLDSNFKTIVAAVEEGRNIFENIKKVILYLLSGSFTEIVLIGGSLFLGLPIPVLPAQILWINIVEDSLPALALAFEEKDKTLMAEAPRKRDIPLIDKEIKILLAIISLTTDFFLLLIYIIMLKLNLDFSLIRTFIFASLASTSLFYIFSCKNLRAYIWKINIFSNKFLLLSVGTGFLMIFSGVYLPFLNFLLKTKPLPLLFWLIILGKSLFTVLAIELIKGIFIHKRKNYSLAKSNYV